MSIQSAFKVSRQAVFGIVISAAGMVALSTGTAEAKCFVNEDGPGGYHQRGFDGTNAQTIWERYCKPYIQRTVANNNIQNGTFGMNCHGRIRCKITGRLEHGSLVVTELYLGGRRTSTNQPTVVRPRNDAIFSDPGWGAFDDAVRRCSNGSRRTTGAQRLTADRC